MGIQKRWRIERKSDGVLYGIYPGETAIDAIDAMYADSGRGIDGEPIRGLDPSYWAVTEVGAHA